MICEYCNEEVIEYKESGIFVVYECQCGHNTFVSKNEVEEKEK